MFIEVFSFQINKPYLLLVLQEPDVISINLFQNSKTFNNFVSNYHLFNPYQTYRGRRSAFVTPINPSLVIFT